MTTTTIKRMTFCISKIREEQLVELEKKLGENRSQIVSRAIDYLYYHHIEKEIS